MTVLVEVRKKGQRTRSESLGAREKRFAAQVHLHASAPVTQEQMWADAERALFGRSVGAMMSSRPKPIVAVQPTRRIIHDTRLPHHNI